MEFRNELRNVLQLMIPKYFKYFSVLLIFNCLYLTNCNTDEDAPQVYIDNDEFKGKIIGKRFQEANVEYMGFRGIPYAKPPINQLRFKDPQKLNKFEGTLFATHDGFECCSVTARNASEDCLNLNIYTKQLSSTKLLPVIVLIHPGGLYLGSGASFFMKPGHMMGQDLVLLTFNYRLGPLGYLNLGTTEIPGNAGFKDQVYALRWVQTFIKHFGGNPEDVTLMGYSAGSLSVQFHLMSTVSKDLFHKAIMMSCSLPPQTYVPQGQQKYLAVRLAKRLNCEKFLTLEEEIPYGVQGQFADYEDIHNEDILECLNQYNGSVIGGTLRSMFDFPKDNPIILWLPVIERDFQQERFLTENFTVARKNVLIGYTNGELGLSAKYLLESDYAKTKFSNEFDILAPRCFMYERYRSRDTITNKIKQKYFNGSTDFSFKHYDAISDVFSDSIVRFGSHKFADFLSSNEGLVYFYEFSFVDDTNKGKDNRFPGKQDRCEHMEDFQYLFNWSDRKHDTGKEKKMVQLYTSFIYDFVKNGKLSHPKAQPYPQSYASIKENIEYKEGRSFKNYEFWQQLFPNYFNLNLK